MPLTTFCYANIRGLYPKSNQTKIPMLKEMAHEDKLLFMTFTESHLNSDHLDAEINIANYTVFRADRKIRKNGGVITYVKSEVAATTEKLVEYSNGTVEMLALKLTNLNLILITVYRPPNTTQEEFQPIIDKTRDILLNLPAPDTEVIIVGDFNFPSVNWTDMKISGGTAEERQQATALKRLNESFYLSQIIREPTRGNNILDLVITNSFSLIHSYHTINTIMSDHKLIYVHTNINSLHPINTQPKDSLAQNTLGHYNFHSKHTNWPLLKKALKETDWNLLLSDKNNVDDILHEIMTTCQANCNKYVPKKAILNKRNMIPRDRKILMRKRYGLQQRLGVTHYTPAREQLEQKIREIEMQLKMSIEEEQITKEQEAVKNIKGNPRYFFSYANKKLKTTSSVGPLLSKDNALTVDSTDMANILREQYESVFSAPKSEKIVVDKSSFFKIQRDAVTQLNTISISEAEIEEAISEISPNSAAGPDGFHPKFLKMCSAELAKPLQLLWSKSLESGLVPELSKTGIITPIHKGGSKGLPSNYRPVVLTSHLIKICEKVVKKKLTTFLEAGNHLNKGQHGFRRGRSCLSQLLHHYEDILKGIQEGNNTDVIYLDFAKAFDKVDHGVLLHKLRDLGVTGSLGRWIHSFLTGRTQRVSVQGKLSEHSIVRSGVPQGSVLGPLLFLIHVNDIDANLLHASASSFADDTRIRMNVKNVADTRHLQHDINQILIWAQNNNMSLNGEKFELLRYGNNKHLIDTTIYQFSDQTIPASAHVKDLGIHMSNDATFTHHYSNIAEVARRLSGWVLRTFKTREENCLITLWKTLILPRLEYCCQLWSPHKLQDIVTLEAVQRTFTTKIKGLHHLNYWERLNHLKLYSLQRRRERYIVIYAWKILEKMVPNVGLQENPHQRRGRLCYVRDIQGTTLRLRTLTYNSFSHNSARLFNCLPRHLRDLTGITPDTFKRHLDKWLSTLPDEPPIPGYPNLHNNTLTQVTSRLRKEEQQHPGSSGGPPQLCH